MAQFDIDLHIITKLKITINLHVQRGADIFIVYPGLSVVELYFTSNSMKGSKQHTINQTENET